jgi:hypothetical protein
MPLERLWDLREGIFQTADFCATRLVPAACRGCSFEATCGGGCVGRRILAGDPEAPDPYCPILRGDALRLQARVVPGTALLKSGSACTTVLRAEAGEGTGT